MTRFTGDRSLAYELAGAGDPPLVFVHGWGCDRTFFEPQFRHFAARHAVAALDLRGHGESRPGLSYDAEALADDVLTVAADAGLHRPVVVGHSLGGLIALACAARPDAVRAAVLVDPSPVLNGPGKAIFTRSVADVASDQDGSWRAALVAGLFGPHDTARRAETIAGVDAVPLPVAVGTWRAMADFDGAAVLPRVNVPEIGSAHV